MTLVLDRVDPQAPMLATWVEDDGRVSRAVAVKDGRVLEVALDEGD